MLTAFISKLSNNLTLYQQPAFVTCIFALIIKAWMQSALTCHTELLTKTSLNLQHCHKRLR